MRGEPAVKIMTKVEAPPFASSSAGLEAPLVFLVRHSPHSVIKAYLETSDAKRSSGLIVLQIALAEREPTGIAYVKGVSKREPVIS